MAEKKKPYRNLEIFVPCHNRKSITLAFIHHLHHSIPKSTTHRIHLLDDGSTDGTASAIKQCFPSVRIEQLGGKAFWGGALEKIRELVNFYATQRPDFIQNTYIMVCNDDIRLEEGLIEYGLNQLLSHADVVCPSTQKAVFNPEAYDTTQAQFMDIQDPIHHGTHFDSITYTFKPIESAGITNIAETHLILTKPEPWIECNSIPKDIPHYLSDYWLTHHFHQLGFQIQSFGGPRCFVHKETTRNQAIENHSLKSALRHDLKCIYMRILNKKKEINFYFMRRMANKANHLKNSVDHKSASYLRAHIAFRSEFSKENQLHQKLRAIKLQDKLIRLLFRATLRPIPDHEFYFPKRMTQTSVLTYRPKK